VGSGIAAPATDPTEAVTAAEVADVRGELARAAGGAAKEGSAATLLFSMLLVSMPGGTLAGPPSPTAVGGSIAGMTSIAEAVDTSEGSCGSDEFGTSKNCGDDADFVVSPTAVERSTTDATSSVEPIDASDESCGPGTFGASKCCGDDADLDVAPTAMESCSIAGAASTAEAVDTSADPCGSGEFGGAKSCMDRTDINVSVTDASGVNGWIDDSRTEVVADADSPRYSRDETSPLGSWRSGGATSPLTILLASSAARRRSIWSRTAS